MGDAGTVIHGRGLEFSQGSRHRDAIEQVDRAPAHARVVQKLRLASSVVRPRGNRLLFFKELIDEVTAREPGGAGDQ